MTMWGTQCTICGKQSGPVTYLASTTAPVPASDSCGGHQASWCQGCEQFIIEGYHDTQRCRWARHQEEAARFQG